ncbi:MAG: hypothetical protein CM1200mP18_15120 [Gammaproteobacteria bacterium]|nr:MAG: hypothetical protein CM1200mP18_15120 [Gammaproteobacteria bacterium]
MNVHYLNRGKSALLVVGGRFWKLDFLFKTLSRSDLPSSDEVQSTYPVGKLPLAIIDGRVLFESAAICTYLADHSPDINLIAKPGSWARSQHDQWTSFVLTEMEHGFGNCCEYIHPTTRSTNGKLGSSRMQ